MNGAGVAARRWGISAYAPIVVAIMVLVAVSAVAAPSSTSGRQIENVVFYASLLGLATLGQFLVVLSGGIDLSIGPTIALSAVVFADVAQDDTAGSILGGAGLALVAALCVGVVNGLAVCVLRITPLIATLAVGALATGAAYSVIGDGAPDAVPSSVTDATIQRPILGLISYLTVVWIALSVVAAVVLRLTVVGRGLTSAGANPRAARLVGIRVDRYRGGAYVAASVCYGLLGLAVTGLAGQPSVDIGDSYLLPSIAAVVVAGARLGGGTGSVAAVAGGALFVTQLDSLTLSLKASTGVQLIVQAAVIATAMAVYRLDALKRLGTLRRKEAASPEFT